MPTNELVGSTHLRHKGVMLGVRQNAFKLIAPTNSPPNLPMIALPVVAQGVLQVSTVGQIIVYPSLSVSAPTQRSDAHGLNQNIPASGPRVAISSVAWMPDQSTIFMSTASALQLPTPATLFTAEASSTFLTLVSSAQQSSASPASPTQTSAEQSPLTSAGETQASIPTNTLTTSAGSRTPTATSSAFNGGYQTLSSSQNVEVVTGVAFGVIAGIACLIAFVVWLFKIRKKGTGHIRIDDSEVQNGRTCPGSSDMKAFMEGSLHAQLPFDNGPDMLDFASTSEKFPRPGECYGVPPLAPFELSAYPTPRPLPAHLRSADTQAPQSLGTLKVTNLFPGDASSSSAGSQPPTRSSSAMDLPLPDAPGGAQLSGEFGTPREAYLGINPRYLTLGGDGLDVPWKATAAIPDQVNNLSDVETKSFDTLPLPFSPSPVIHPIPVSASHSSGWGTALRSSFFNAISTMKGREFWSSTSIDTGLGGDDSDCSGFNARPARSTTSLEWVMGTGGSGLGIVMNAPNVGGSRAGEIIGKDCSAGNILTHESQTSPPLPWHKPAVANELDDNSTTAGIHRKSFLRRTTSERSASTLESSASSMEMTDRELLVKRVISARRRRRKNMSIKLGTGSSLLRGGGTVVSRRSIKGARLLKKRL